MTEVGGGRVTDIGNSVLGRAFGILGAYGPDDVTLTLTDLVPRTGLPKTTVHRLAEQLVEEGALERSFGGYRIGLRLYELGELTPLIRCLRDVALPFLEDLVNATNEIAALGILDGNDVLYVEKLTGHRTPPTPHRKGGRLPAHCSAVGKVILAFSPPEVIASVVQAGMQPLTPRSIRSPAVLRQELTGIARTGVAYDTEETKLGLCGVAAPVMWRGRPVAGLAVGGLSLHFHRDRVGPLVAAKAKQLAQALYRTMPKL